jgi:predicted glutamine amidotransferase
MCRLFGLHAGGPVRATFWLLDAPDSLAAQSHRNPDGAGIGVFYGNGRPRIDKAPIAAWEDCEFATTARTLTSATFVAHVRYASTGEHTLANTHPFTQDGRIFAHNGAVTGLATIDQRIAELGVSQLVGGETDSERLFALISGEIRAHCGDVDAGLVAALTWLANAVPIYAVNIILAEPDRLWGLRYPDTHELHVLPRLSGGHRGGAGLRARSQRIRAESDELSAQPSVVVASERLDDDPGWRSVEPGELLRVNADLSVTRSFPLPAQPRHRLALADLDPRTAASQHPQRR